MDSLKLFLVSLEEILIFLVKNPRLKNLLLRPAKFNMKNSTYKTKRKNKLKKKEKSVMKLERKRKRKLD